MTDKTQEAKNIIKTLPGMHLFKKYIDTKLAGDFAYKLAKVLKNTVQLSQEEYDFLKSCQEEMKANPSMRRNTYTITETEKVTAGDGHAEGSCWYDEEGHCFETDEELADSLIESVDSELIRLYFGLDEIDDLKDGITENLDEDFKIDGIYYTKFVYKNQDTIKETAVFSWFRKDAEEYKGRCEEEYRKKIKINVCGNGYGGRMSRLQDLIKELVLN